MAVKLRNPRKKVALGSPIYRVDTPDFGHAFSNYTYFRPCGRIWLSCVQRARRLEGKNKEDDDDESLVKCKSADNYVGRPNMLGLVLRAFWNSAQAEAGHSKPNEHAKKLSKARQWPFHTPRSAPPRVCQGIT